jgi:hypothetical protein
MDSVTIIFSPHFDDAVLSLGGFLSYLKNKSNIVIATFFTAPPSHDVSTKFDLSSGFRTSTEAVTEREKENERSLKLLNCKIKNFGYVDSQYRNSDIFIL